MKKGLKEFQEVYDLTGNLLSLGLDLAQNLHFKLTCAKPKYAKITEEDVHMAYSVSGMGKKYPIDLFKAVHKLAKALGYTRKDYIEGADKRAGRGNMDIHIIGEGPSINCDIKDLIGASDENSAKSAQT